MSVAGYPEQYVWGTQTFWNKLGDYDREGVIGSATPTDGVGMAFAPPFTVWFPTPEGMEQLRGAATVPILEQWSDPNRQVWVFNAKDVFPKDAHPFFKPLNRVFVVFKFNSDAGQAAGDCHARQVITVLYTGEADEAALVDCLKEEDGQ